MSTDQLADTQPTLTIKRRNYSIEDTQPTHRIERKQSVSPQKTHEKWLQKHTNEILATTLVAGEVQNAIAGGYWLFQSEQIGPISMQNIANIVEKIGVNLPSQALNYLPKSVDVLHGIADIHLVVALVFGAVGIVAVDNIRHKRHG